MSGLSPRQHEVLDLVAEGLSNKQVAARLGITESAVKKHVSALFREFHVESRVGVVRAAERSGVIESLG